jgi:hypothetical protein
MTRRLRSVAPTWVWAALTVALLMPSPARADSTWVEHYRAARVAYAAGDFQSFRAQLTAVGRMIGEQPGVEYNLACAAAHLGEREEALRRLRLYAVSGLVHDAGADSDFVSLWSDPQFQQVFARIRANGDSIGLAVVHHRFGDASLLTEDLAYDPVTKSFFASSVHRGRVVEVTSAGVERELVDAALSPGWGVFAARVDAPRRLLWTSVGSTKTADGYVAADSGRTGLVAWDLRTHRPVRRLEWRADGRPHLIGDLTVGPDGTVYATDSPSGALRIVRPGADSIATLIPDRGLEGPQTPALALDGRHLYIAEYGPGIRVLDLRTGALRHLTFAPGVGLQGIDGLYVHGRELLAVQNGTRPERVMRFRLDASGTHVLSGVAVESGTRRLGDPTHGVLVGDDFYFLANTGWDRVGRDELLSPEPATPAAILKARL